jgi:predicted nucleic-acid-binding protein
MAERVFADTNLFLRYLTNDVPAQADAVEALLDRAAAGELRLETSALVIAEIVWALEGFYGLDRAAVRDKVLAIVNTPGIHVEDDHLVIQACAWYVDARVDYADAWNAAWLQDRALTAAYTFDRRHFRRLGGVAVRVPGEDEPSTT